MSRSNGLGCYLPIADSASKPVSQLGSRLQLFRAAKARSSLAGLLVPLEVEGKGGLDLPLLAALAHERPVEQLLWALLATVLATDQLSDLLPELMDLSLQQFVLGI